MDNASPAGLGVNGIADQQSNQPCRAVDDIAEQRLRASNDDFEGDSAAAGIVQLHNPNPLHALLSGATQAQLLTFWRVGP